MKLKLTLYRAGGSQPQVDLVVNADPDITIGELARSLASTDPAGSGKHLDNLTLGLVGQRHRRLDPARVISDGGLRSGACVTIDPAGSGDAADNVAAVVRVLAGPDGGREFRLPPGTAVIGREPGCAIVLTDGMVSREHARLNIGDTVEIIDLGSANGILLDNNAVARTELRPSDVVQLGDTELTVTLLDTSSAVGTGTALVPFVRSPRLETQYRRRTFKPPTPPDRPAPVRLPLIAMFAPLVLGGVLFAITRSLVSVAFVAMSPVLLLGQAVESKFGGRSAFKRATKEWRADLDLSVAEMRAAAEDEVAARCTLNPSADECVQAVRSRSPLMWTRRPGSPSFGVLRFGLGRLPSINQVEREPADRAPVSLVAELEEALSELATVAGVPVCVPLGDGAVGIAGPRPEALQSARALLTQAVALHSPAEFEVAAFASSQTARDWDWLKWLPHTSSAHSALQGPQLAGSGPAGAALANRLEDLVADRRASRSEDTAGPAVLVLVEDDAPMERGRLVALAETGPAVGVYFVWVAAAVEALPAACRQFVEVAADATGVVRFVDGGVTVAGVALDTVAAEVALDVARQLAPCVDSGARTDDESELPALVPTLSLLGPNLATAAESVIDRWRETQSLVSGPHAADLGSQRTPTLRAVVGQWAAGPHTLDLRVDGPHALVGGTTGAGKSELLQSWILGMATAHSPQRVTFLLVDYKGGAAFSDCVALPHTVGMVTDLSPHLVRRALTSLRAELVYRERILHRYDAKDLVTLERTVPHAAPPSLVIIVDEFAALTKEIPEFVGGVVDIAQRGRSLGLHLILATQRPAGVITDSLRANTNLRVALRMADEDDSIDVLGSAEAARFDPSVPGRAVSKTGPGRLIRFQAAYAGGWSGGSAQPDVQVEELVFGVGPGWESVHTDEPTSRDPEHTDIKRLVRSVVAASQIAEIPAPRKPWLPELRSVYDLADPAQVATQRRDDQLVFGIRDDPRSQSQLPVAFHPDVEGSMVVYGAGGSGKSTFLRTIAIAAGFTVRGGPCHVYGLDFGARGLAMLEDLPHVGSIIVGTDHERIVRLLTWLRDTVAERALRYHRAGAASITAYRARTGQTSEPRIIVLVDGVAAFRSAYDSPDRVRWFESFVSIAAEGRPVGVHTVISADQRTGVSSALSAAVQRRLVLRMASAEDYGALGVPNDVLSRTSPRGRGLLDEAEVQVAVLSGSPDVAEQAASVRSFADAMRRAGSLPAPPIRALPTLVRLAELPVGAKPVIGIAASTLEPFAMEPRGGFVLCGPPASGRTTALRTIAEALRRWRPEMRLQYFAPRRSDLADLDVWSGKAIGIAEVAAAAAGLAAELAEWPNRPPHSLAVVIESVAELGLSAADMPLQDLVKMCLAEDDLVIAEGETSNLVSSFGLVGMVKSSRAGLALQPDVLDGPSVFRTDFPRLKRVDFPTGRALHVRGGRTEVVHLAFPS